MKNGSQSEINRACLLLTLHRNVTYNRGYLSSSDRPFHRARSFVSFVRSRLPGFFFLLAGCDEKEFRSCHRLEVLTVYVRASRFSVHTSVRGMGRNQLKVSFTLQLGMPSSRNEA